MIIYLISRDADDVDLFKSNAKFNRLEEHTHIAQHISQLVGLRVGSVLVKSFDGT